MRRGQRRTHLLIWVLMLPALVVGVALALTERPGVPFVSESELVEIRSD